MLDLFKKHPIVPVFYDEDPEVCKTILKDCYEAGIRLFEFVNRGSQALENFKILKPYAAEFPGLKLGIGTIKTEKAALQFIEAGAEFIVSPIVTKKLAKITKKHKVLWIPGCMTPTEIALAERLKCKLVKIFPAGTLGPKFVKGLKPIFPDMHFMPTGGVSLDPENLKTWFDAGVVAVGIGSALFPSSTEKKVPVEVIQTAFQRIEEGTL